MQLTMPGGWSPEDKIWYQRKSWDMNWGRRRIAGCAQSSSIDQWQNLSCFLNVLSSQRQIFRVNKTARVCPGCHPRWRSHPGAQTSPVPQLSSEGVLYLLFPLRKIPLSYDF